MIVISTILIVTITILIVITTIIIITISVTSRHREYLKLSANVPFRGEKSAK